MKKLLMFACAVLLSGLFVTAATAGEPGDPQAPPPDQAQVQSQDSAQAPATGESNVPQATIDLYKKREEARQRVQDLLKVREQAIQAGQQ